MALHYVVGIGTRNFVYGVRQDRLNSPRWARSALGVLGSPQTRSEHRCYTLVGVLERQSFVSVFAERVFGLAFLPGLGQFGVRHTQSIGKNLDETP